MAKAYVGFDPRSGAWNRIAGWDANSAAVWKDLCNQARVRIDLADKIAVIQRIDPALGRPDEVGERIDAIRKTIGEIGKRIDKVHERIHEIRDRIDGICTVDKPESSLENPDVKLPKPDENRGSDTRP